MYLTSHLQCSPRHGYKAWVIYLEGRLQKPPEGPFASFHLRYDHSFWLLFQIFPDNDLEKPVAACYLNHGSAQPILALDYVAEPLRDDIVVAYFIQRRKFAMGDLALDVMVGGPW